MERLKIQERGWYLIEQVIEEGIEGDSGSVLETEHYALL